MPVLLTRHWKLAIVWALSLFAAGVVSSSAQAQRGPTRQPGMEFRPITVSPTVVSGNDIGFRIERTENGIQVGKLVVRVDGRWVDTGLTTSAIWPR